MQQFTLADPPGVCVLRHDARVSVARWSPRGNQIATAQVDGTASRWDVAARMARPIAAADVRCLAFADDGSALATGSAAGTTQLWHTASARTIGKALPGDGAVRRVQVLPQRAPFGRRVLAVTDKTVTVWDVEAGKPVAGPFVCEAKICSSAVSSDGALLALGHDNLELDVRDAATLQRTFRMGLRPSSHLHLRRVVALAFSAGGRWLATSTEAGALCVLETGAWRTVFEKPSLSALGNLVFSPDDKALVGFAKSNSGRWAWNTATWEGVAQTFRSDRMTSASFSPDGRHLFYTALDGVAEIWRTQPLECWSAFEVEAGPTIYGQFSPSGDCVLTVHALDKSVRIWPLDPLAAAEKVRPADVEEGFPVPIREWRMGPAGMVPIGRR